VVRGRRGLALGAEQPLEPALAEALERFGGGGARAVEDRGQLWQRDALLLLVPLNRVGDPRQLGSQVFVCRQQLEPVVVEARGRVAVEDAELLASVVLGEDCQHRLGGAQRHFLTAERHAGGEDCVLELVAALRELSGRDAGLTCLAQAVDPLALLAVDLRLGRAERFELLAREEIGVARHDRRLLGDLLLADAHGASLLRTLEQVVAKAFLVFGRGADCGNAHRPGIYRPTSGL
jgi:hypothetical protein